jgi:hypothetical protein
MFADLIGSPERPATSDPQHFGTVAARITRSARRTRLRIAEGWPWAADLLAAFTRLAALPPASRLTPPSLTTSTRISEKPATASGHRHTHRSQPPQTTPTTAVQQL